MSLGIDDAGGGGSHRVSRKLNKQVTVASIIEYDDPSLTSPRATCADEDGSDASSNSSLFQDAANVTFERHVSCSRCASSGTTRFQRGASRRSTCEGGLGLSDAEETRVKEALARHRHKVATAQAAADRKAAAQAGRRRSLSGLHRDRRGSLGVTAAPPSPSFAASARRRKSVHFGQIAGVVEDHPASKPLQGLGGSGSGSRPRRRHWSVLRSGFGRNVLKAARAIDHFEDGLSRYYSGSPSDSSDEDYPKMLVAHSVSHQSTASERSRGTRRSSGRRISNQSQVSQTSGAPTKRKSVLSVLKMSRYLSRLSVGAQVAISRQLVPIHFGEGLEDDATPDSTIFKVGESAEPDEEPCLYIVESGSLQLCVPDRDGMDYVLGKALPGSIVGGLQALGLASKHLFTVRHCESKDQFADSEESSEGEEQVAKKNRFKEQPKDQEETVLHRLGGQVISKLRATLPEDMEQIRMCIMKDLRKTLLPCIRALAKAGFFSRHSDKFVNNITRLMHLRIFKPGELIFKDGAYARALGMIICGKIDILVNGRFVATRGGCGLTFGETALISDARRTATVQCSADQECLLCILNKEEFLAEVEKFPEEKQRLSDHVKSHLTQLTLTDYFRECDPSFMHFLASRCEVLRVPWGQFACLAGEGVEVMHVNHQGACKIQRPEGSMEDLPKGVGIGLHAALGLQTGPPDYSLVGGWRGCVLIRVTHEAIRGALRLFPEQLDCIAKYAGGATLPEDHPTKAGAGKLKQKVRLLVCRALTVPDCAPDLMEYIESRLRVHVYDPGETIVKAGDPCGAVMLLIHGQVMMSRAKKFHQVTKAPRDFSEDAFTGVDAKHTATLGAVTTCVVHFLPVHFMAERALPIDPAGGQATQEGAAPASDEGDVRRRLALIVRQSMAMREQLKASLLARFRNMRLFRRLRSEILATLSKHIEMRTFLEQDSLVVQGEPANCMYIVLQGAADGESRSFDAGAIVGDEMVFGAGDQPKYIRTVRARGLCVCNAIGAELIAYAFRRFLDDPMVQGWPYTVDEGVSPGFSGRMPSRGAQIAEQHGSGNHRTTRCDTLSFHIQKARSSRAGLLEPLQTPGGSCLPSQRPSWSATPVSGSQGHTLNPELLYVAAEVVVASMRILEGGESSDDAIAEGPADGVPPGAAPAAASPPAESAAGAANADGRHALLAADLAVWLNRPPASARERAPTPRRVASANSRWEADEGRVQGAAGAYAFEGAAKPARSRGGLMLPPPGSAREMSGGRHCSQDVSPVLSGSPMSSSPSLLRLDNSKMLASIQRPHSTGTVPVRSPSGRHLFDKDISGSQILSRMQRAIHMRWATGDAEEGEACGVILPCLTQAPAVDASVSVAPRPPTQPPPGSPRRRRPPQAVSPMDKAKSAPPRTPPSTSVEEPRMVGAASVQVAEFVVQQELMEAQLLEWRLRHRLLDRAHHVNSVKRRLGIGES